MSHRKIIRFGEPFTLMSNRSADPANVQFSLPTMYHSHFWTAAFADLNYGKAAEAEQSRAFKAVAEAADKWVRMGVDGFRLDAVKHIYHNAYNDENPTFLKKFYDRMNESYKAAGGEGDFYMVGEMLDEADKAAPYYRGLPALFEFTFWYKLKWALQNVMLASELLAKEQPDYHARKKELHEEIRQNADSKAVRYLYSYLYSKLLENCAAPSIRYIAEHYDLPITVNQLAEMESYNVTYYNDWFKQQTGCSPSLYLRRVRVDRAKELLLDTGFTVMEIAVMVGYSSNATFTRAFHSITGMTPKAYRECACRRRTG